MLTVCLPSGCKSLPIFCFEPQSRSVFTDGAFDLVRRTGREFSIDFQGDVQRSVGVGGEEADDFFGDLDEVDFGGVGLYLD